MNALLDAIDVAVAPSGADALAGNKQTLGGLVSHCYPLGPVFIDTGDTDGKAVAAIPFQILCPSGKRSLLTRIAMRRVAKRKARFSSFAIRNSRYCAFPHSHPGEPP